MANGEENNSLYFIVGGLVVLALIFGFLVWGPNNTGMNPAGLEPSAGGTQTDQTRIDFNNEDNGGSVTTTHTDGQ